MDGENKKGLAGCGTCADDMADDVYGLLRKGSPMLAYAVACGVPLAPWKTSVQGIFATTAVVTVPEVANSTKLVQDTIVDRISYQVQNLNTPTSDFSSFAEYFYSLQSGIEAKLKVVGTPRYAIVDSFTPISLIAGPTGGWILTMDEGLVMDFNATVTLPFAPLKITFTFECRTTHWAKLIKMDNGTALTNLTNMGYDCSQFKETYGC